MQDFKETNGEKDNNQKKRSVDNVLLSNLQLIIKLKRVNNHGKF